MKKIITNLIFLFVFLFSMSTNSYGQITSSAYNDYTGTLDNSIKIHMSIYNNNGKLNGSYFYDKIGKSIELKGSLNGNSITLNEYASAGTITGIFTGSETSNDSIKGTFTNKKAGTSFSFLLNKVSEEACTSYGHRYEIAGISDDSSAEKFAETFKAYVKSGNSAKIASMINYPVHVSYNGKRTVIKTKKDFAKKYPLIFKGKFKDTIISTPSMHMFSNYQGVMFGSGMYNVWFLPINGKLLIAGINN